MRNKLLFTMLLFAVLSGGLLAAEGDRENRGRARPDRDRRPRRDMDEMRKMVQQRIMTAIQDRLSVSDDEWAVVKPRVETVMELKQKDEFGANRGMVNVFRRRGPERNAEDLEGSRKEAAELEAALEKEEPDIDEIKKELSELRAARAKEQQKLLEAQKKLKEILTVVQEAQMVSMGLLK
ncbi:hypothetical protein L21SP3_00936 [Sedimentisphaera cyanobacteriorum]|uniref:Periplasmic heavy metal sensor n=1 Tax=Sedimentisphaera cyanobacteriorum TaxID=1940790 RepID=A0A1Q2HPF2_9BACT|nr:hypothetical protein [Sedimentisphaera cyanobacteriorum]AQQ09136.1 hypothetical protein L21SP3_00936 [Sedimentisphaera cyanobacteriorum]